MIWNWKSIRYHGGWLASIDLPMAFVGVVVDIVTARAPLPAGLDVFSTGAAGLDDVL